MKEESKFKVGDRIWITNLEQGTIVRFCPNEETCIVNSDFDGEVEMRIDGLNVQELKVKIDGWIAECKKTDTPMTKSGLCLCLDISKDTLNAYLHSAGADTTVYSKSEIDGELHPVSVADLLKRAVLAIENSLERRMISGKGNVAGIIFDLKNNHGYADKSEVSTVNTNAKAVSDEDIDKRIAELMNKSDVFRRSS